MKVHPRKEVDSLYLERKAKVRYLVSTEDCQNSLSKEQRNTQVDVMKV